MPEMAAPDQAPGVNPHTVRQTAAAAINLPATMHLARIDITGHATEPTVLGILYNGVARAMFYCEPAGKRTFLIDIPNLKNLNAAWLTVISDDAPVEWNLTFDDVGYGPGPEFYRGIFFECEVANSGTAVAVDFDETTEGGNVPLAIWCGQTTGVAAAVSRWAFPAIGSRQVTVLGSDEIVSFPPSQAPPLPKSDSLTLTPTVVGAATYAVAVVFY